MVVCCRCNGGGNCRKCVCVKANRLCSTCLPLRNGKCLNIKQKNVDPLTSTPALTPASTCDSNESSVVTVSSSSTSKLADSQMHSLPVADSLTDLSSKSPINAHHIQLPSVEPTTPLPFLCGESMTLTISLPVFMMLLGNCTLAKERFSDSSRKRRQRVCERSQ